MTRIETRLDRSDLQALQIINVYNQATPGEMEAGKLWYSSAYRICLHIANKFNCPITKVVGVVSALSPGTNWNQNIADAHNLILAWYHLIDPAEVVVTTYGANKRKAIRVLNLNSSDSEDIERLLLHKSKINKTGSFFWNILRYSDREHVTVDRHAIRIALGPEYLDNACMTEKRYRTTVEAYKIAAKGLNLRGNELQAITWCAYRRLNHIEVGVNNTIYSEIEKQIIKGV